MPRIIRFGSAGAVATGVQVSAVWSVFNWLVRDSTVANVTAFVIANVVSFLSQALWSFSSRPSIARFVYFPPVSTGGFLVGALVPLLWGRHVLWLPNFAVVICIPALSYVLHARWTYGAA